MLCVPCYTVTAEIVIFGSASFFLWQWIWGRAAMHGILAPLTQWHGIFGVKCFRMFICLQKFKRWIFADIDSILLLLPALNMRYKINAAISTSIKHVPNRGISDSGSIFEIAIDEPQKSFDRTRLESRIFDHNLLEVLNY